MRNKSKKVKNHIISLTWDIKLKTMNKTKQLEIHGPRWQFSGYQREKVEPEGRGVRKALKTDYHQTESFLLSLLKEWKEDWKGVIFFLSQSHDCCIHASFKATLCTTQATSGTRLILLTPVCLSQMNQLYNIAPSKKHRVTLRNLDAVNTN